MAPARYRRRPAKFRPRRQICDSRHEAELREREATRPERWFTLSFFQRDLGYLGTIIIRARGPHGAFDRAKAMGICPPLAGCSLDVGPLEESRTVPEKFANRLLSEADMSEFLVCLEAQADWRVE